MKRLFRVLSRWGLWLAVKYLGRRCVPVARRLQLRLEESVFDHWIRNRYEGMSWKNKVLRFGLVQPFQDLLNRPSGGEAYCGGVIFHDPAVQPTLRHFRGQRAIDRPLTSLAAGQASPLFIDERQFWCGPLAFHFGHQIADFGSRALLSSLDPRSGELLWCPWRSGLQWNELLPWQQFLLTYLNPGGKRHRFCTAPLRVKELVVIPQQARMHASPTQAHLEALSWCERSLRPHPNRVVYVSRARFARCTDRETLLGGFAAEALLEKFLVERGVTLIHPETLSLKDQIEMYLGAEAVILAEGSAQHGLELLGFNKNKEVIVLCRRSQIMGMDKPLRARFPKAQFLEVLKSQWMSADGVAWNGLSLLDWDAVAACLNNFLSFPISESDCSALEIASETQLRKLHDHVSLVQINNS